MARVMVPYGDTVRGAKVTAEHFGVNYISVKDEDDDGGALLAYENAVNDLAGSGQVVVRFPGGGVAEDDVNPDAYTVFDHGAVKPGTPTYDFLLDAAQNGWAVQIVLPTWRYVDQDTLAVDTETAAQEVAKYAGSLFEVADALGVTIEGFEIGNEFDLLAEKTNGSAWLDGDETGAWSQAYAEIAATITATLEGKIAAAGLSGADAPWIGVQALWSWLPEHWRKPTEFRDAMDTAFEAAGATGAVDALITHIYPWLQLEQNPLDWLEGETHTIDNLEELDAVFGGGLDWIASEWGVSFGAGEAIDTLKDSYDGIKQLEPVVSLFSQMVSAGLDHMNIWPVRNGAFTALETLEGAEKPMSYMFDMMSDQLVGTRVLDLNGSDAGTMWEVGDSVHVYGFEGKERTVLYFGSRSDTAQVVDLSLAAYRGDGDLPTIAVSRIFVDDPEAKGYLQGTHVETAAYSYDWFENNAEEVLTFSPYEMVVVEVVYELDKGEKEIGTAGNDFLYGTTGDDTLKGTGGDDWLHGRLGADRLVGGDGNDVIYGGSQGDDILAGDGDDYVEGGKGQDFVDLGNGADVFMDNAQGSYFGSDFIDGGGGNDRLSIGNGDDLVTGGGGNDVFAFGTVSSEIGENTIIDFTPGEDVLEIGGSTYATLDALVARFDVYSDGEDTVIEVDGMGWITLEGLDASDLDGVKDAPELIVVEGSSGADTNLGGTPFDARLAGRRGADKLYGRDGDDILHGGAGRDWLYGGTGDDRLIDGAGRDVMIGGAGADIFRLKDDGQTDRIRDFEQGIDCIDLSKSEATGYGDLDISVRDETWLEVHAGDDLLLVQVNDTAGFAFTAGDFLF